MKQLKEFETKKELNEAITAIEKQGIRCEGNEFALYVHVGNLIQARDIILNLADEKKKLEKWGKVK